MRYIEPETILQKRLGGGSIPRFDGAMLLFRDRYTSSLIKYILGCRPLERKLLYGIDANNVHRIISGGSEILVVEQLIWGGPQAAIIIEELGVMGVTKLIGVGACGAICSEFIKGDIVVDERAYVTDGTSKYYTDAELLAPDSAITDKARSVGCKAASSATIDALYRETDIAVDRFRKLGAGIINMESATLYAVAAKLAISAVWIGCVSDVLTGEKWEGWFDSKAATIKSAELAAAFAGRFF